MTDVGVFPFGQRIHTVTQLHRGARRVFVLGVYASAVHARWTGADGKTRVRALAVASEPEIFWQGGQADEVIRRIVMPGEAGYLTPAARSLNGPSGRALDECYLDPLRVSRAAAWLCDLIPYSCMNDGQCRAIHRAYRPLIRALGLPEVDWPKAPRTAGDWQSLVDRRRRDQIAAEVAAASPEVLITLGDIPLKRFGRCFGTGSALADYGESPAAYGRLHEVTIAGCRLQLLPLAHPRQAARLGRSSAKWADLHRNWMTTHAPALLGRAAPSETNPPGDSTGRPRT